MEEAARHDKVPIGVDGMRGTSDDGSARSLALLVLAVTLLALAAGLLLEGGLEPAPDPMERTSRAAAGTPARADANDVPGLPQGSATRVATRPRLEPRRMSEEALLRALQRAEARGTIDVGQPGDRAGISAFPPPGTKPLKRGVVVPDDFELPPGYVRHYQTTDDGRQVPAVLMFHPDFELVDASGNVVPLPADRLVPPDLAPAGLAIQLLDAPEPEIDLLEPPGGRREAPAPR